MKTALINNIGKRPVNEDFVLTENIRKGKLLCLVADGMGGYKKGDIAARLISESILTHLSSMDSVSVQDIRNAVIKANQSVQRAIKESQEKMGSTLGGIIFEDERTICFWVGDVKILHVRNNEIIFESTSHSYINEMLSNGYLIPSDQAKKFKHIVTRSIQGDSENSEIDYSEIDKIEKNDLFFLYSDGIQDVLDAFQLVNFFSNTQNIDKTVLEIEERLVLDAKDNFSLIVIKV